MKRKDLVASIFFLILAGLLFINAGKYPVKADGSIVLNPGFYPQLLAVVLGILSLILLFSSLKKGSDTNPKQKIWQNRKAVFLFAVTLSLLILYPFILNFIGFATASFIFLFSLITVLTENAKSRILSILGISLGLTVLMYLVFKVFLHIPFPSGILI